MARGSGSRLIGSSRGRASRGRASRAQGLRGRTGPSADAPARPDIWLPIGEGDPEAVVGEIWEGAGAPEWPRGDGLSPRRLEDLAISYSIPWECSMVPYGASIFEPMPGRFALSSVFFTVGCRVPIPGALSSFFRATNICPSCLAPNSWQILGTILFLCAKHKIPFSSSVVISLLSFHRNPASPGTYFLTSRPGGPPCKSSHKGWKECYFFVHAPVPEGFRLPFRTTWAAPRSRLFRGGIPLRQEQQLWRDQLADLLKVLSEKCTDEEYDRGYAAPEAQRDAAIMSELEDFFLLFPDEEPRPAILATEDPSGEAARARVALEQAAHEAELLIIDGIVSSEEEDTLEEGRLRRSRRLRKRAAPERQEEGTGEEAGGETGGDETYDFGNEDVSAGGSRKKARAMRDIRLTLSDDSGEQGQGDVLGEQQRQQEQLGEQGQHLQQQDLGEAPVGIQGQPGQDQGVQVEGTSASHVTLNLRFPAAASILDPGVAFELMRATILPNDRQAMEGYTTPDLFEMFNRHLASASDFAVQMQERHTAQFRQLEKTARRLEREKAKGGQRRLEATALRGQRDAAVSEADGLRRELEVVKAALARGEIDRAKILKEYEIEKAGMIRGYEAMKLQFEDQALAGKRAFEDQLTAERRRQAEMVEAARQEGYTAGVAAEGGKLAEAVERARQEGHAAGAQSSGGHPDFSWQLKEEIFCSVRQHVQKCRAALHSAGVDMGVLDPILPNLKGTLPTVDTREELKELFGRIRRSSERRKEAARKAAADAEVARKTAMGAGGIAASGGQLPGAGVSGDGAAEGQTSVVPPTPGSLESGTGADA